MRAGLGLPPGVHNRAAFLADDFVIPHPGFGVDRLADGAEQAQGTEIVFGGPLRAPFHEGADGGRGGVEDGDAVFGDDAPEAVRLGEIGGALVHEAGGAVGQRAIDDVAVAGDPADVGGAPIDVLVAEIEDYLVVS